jgi:acylphosphatase
MSEDIVARRVIIRGHVQGVGFRAWTEQMARGHGLAGWVRNRRDGSVEALFAGRAAEVLDMIAACRRGPPSARVETIDEHPATAQELAARPPGETFSLMPTA